MRQYTRRLLIATAALLVGAGLTQAARTLRGAEASYEVNLDAVPRELAGYTGRDLPVDESIYAYLNAQDMLERVYVKGDLGATLSVVYGTDWRTIHAPTGCYPAQGWQIVHDRPVDIEVPADYIHPGPLHAEMVYAVKDERKEVALFVYARPGATTADWTTHGWKVAVGPRGAGGMIIILRRPPQTTDLEKEIEPLKELLRAAYPPAVGFWYDKTT